MAKVTEIMGHNLMLHKIPILLQPWIDELHYSDVVMGAMASKITSLTIVYSTVYWGTDQRKHQSSASLVFVRGINRWPLKFPHKWSVTRTMLPFADVIMSRFRNPASATWRHPGMYIAHNWATDVVPPSHDPYKWFESPMVKLNTFSSCQP